MSWFREDEWLCQCRSGDYAFGGDVAGRDLAFFKRAGDIDEEDGLVWRLEET